MGTERQFQCMVHPKMPQSVGKEFLCFTCGQQFTSITQLCQSHCNSKAELALKIDMCLMQRNYGARHPFSGETELPGAWDNLRLEETGVLVSQGPAKAFPPTVE